MKFLYGICLFLALNTFGFAQNTATTTETTNYYLIRHAEKDKSDPNNRNPHLTEKGQARALNWSKVFEHIDFDVVYSTQYHRTIETATPTAKTKNLEIQFYDPRNLDYQEFKKTNSGRTVLIVGHSNSTPTFVNAIIGKKKYETIDESINGNLYIISITDDTSVDQVLSIN